MTWHCMPPLAEPGEHRRQARLLLVPGEKGLGFWGAEMGWQRGWERGLELWLVLAWPRLLEPSEQPGMGDP